MHISPKIDKLYAKVGAKIAVILTTIFRLPPDLAQDAVHDLFVILLTDRRTADRVTKLNDEEAFRYLLKASQRRAIREMRRRQNTERAPEELLAKLVSTNLPDLDLARTEMLDAIRAGFEQLEDPYREVLKLLLVERKSATEIGRLLNRPVNTIYQQVQRGLHRLRSTIRKLE